MKKLLALLVTTTLFVSMLPLAFSYVPPIPPEPEPEFAVKIAGDWHHTMWEWDPFINDTLPADTWFRPYEMSAPMVGKTFKVEVWVLNVVDLYAYEFRLAWDWCWLELQLPVKVIELGPGGMTAFSDISDADPTTPEVEPVYVQIWTFLRPVEAGYNGSKAVAELTFKVIQDPTYPDAFYSLFYLFFVEASDSCGEPIDPTVEHAVAKLVSIPPVVKKELSKNKTWKVGDTITVDIKIYNATKLKSFEFVLNYPEWLKLDLQKNPIKIGAFLPGPYETYVIVVGPSEQFELCPYQILIKIIRDCNKDPVSGSGTLASITFEVLNPYLVTMGKPGPDYTYCDEQHLWVPENVTGEICFKGDGIAIDGIRCFQWPLTHYDPVQQRYCALLAPPFGFPCYTEFYWDWVDVDPVGIAFVPIPADGNLDGHVGLLDMAMGVPFYGIVEDSPEYDALTAEEKLLWELCDIAGDTDYPGIVNLFDLVQMAKNWCRTEPPKDC